MPKRWTPTELTYLRRYYARRGPNFVADRLNRTYSSVQRKAFSLGLIVGVPKGFVPLAWVAPRNCVASAKPKAVTQARNDGVLQKHGSMYVVPTDWADQYAKRQGQHLRAVREARDWLTTKDLATALDVDPKTVVTNVHKGLGAGRYLRTVTRVRVTSPTPHYKWHPSEATEAVQRYLTEARP